MTYTPLTCEKTAEVNLRACLGSPFVDYTIYPSSAPSLGAIELTGVSDAGGPTLTGYASWIDNGTDQSFVTDIASPTANTFGGRWTGSKFMAWAVTSLSYHVGVIDLDYTDPDDLTGTAMTVTDVGVDGLSIPEVSGFPVGVDYQTSGPSLAGGDTISWFEGRTGEMHFLTSNGTTLTRRQAFPLEGSETSTDFTGRSFTFLSDGVSIWVLACPDAPGPYDPMLVRFTPTAIGDPYDFEKFAITFDDATIDANCRVSGIFVTCTTANTFIVEYTDNSLFGRTKHLEVTKDGSAFTEYHIAGNETVSDFCLDNGVHLTKTGTGANRLISQNFGGDFAVGTYDLVCAAQNVPNQGHCYTRKRTRKGRANDHGFLIPSGDMNDGGDFLITSGDAGGGRFKWQRVQNND